MTRMNDKVTYQIEKATFAMREALKYGAEDLSPYQLGSITEALKELDNAAFYLRTQKLKTEELDPEWDKLAERTVGRPGFKFHTTSEFVPAVSE